MQTTIMFSVQVEESDKNDELEGIFTDKRKAMDSVEKSIDTENEITWTGVHDAFTFGYDMKSDMLIGESQVASIRRVPLNDLVKA